MKNTAPIDQRWIEDYCDAFIAISKDLPDGPMKSIVLRRIECVMDLVEAWQKRGEKP